MSPKYSNFFRDEYLTLDGHTSIFGKASSCYKYSNNKNKGKSTRLSIVGMTYRDINNLIIPIRGVSSTIYEICRLRKRESDKGNKYSEIQCTFFKYI